METRHKTDKRTVRRPPQL